MVVYSLPHDVASRRRRNIEGVQACPLGRPTKPSDWLFWVDFSLCNYPFAASCCLNNYQHLPPKTQQNHHVCGCFEPSPNGRVYILGFPTRALGLQSSFRIGVAKEDPASLEKNVMWETLAAIKPSMTGDGWNHRWWLDGEIGWTLAWYLTISNALYNWILVILLRCK